MGFQQQSVWIKSSFALITIGFVIWLSAEAVLDTDASTVAKIGGNVSRYSAYVAFMIIGVITYYAAVLLNYLYIFVQETEGNPIVLIVGVATAILAGISGIVSASIAGVVPFSDRLTWSMICALVSAAFLLVALLTGGGGAGGGGGAQRSAETHTADFQPNQQVPA